MFGAIDWGWGKESTFYVSFITHFPPPEVPSLYTPSYSPRDLSGTLGERRGGMRVELNRWVGSGGRRGATRPNPSQPPFPPSNNTTSSHSLIPPAITAGNP